MSLWLECVVTAGVVGAISSTVLAVDQKAGEASGLRGWKAGLARVAVTPEKRLWMAGYASRNQPAEGKLQDLWVKVLALEDVQGRRVALVTADLLGFPKTIYENIAAGLKKSYGLEREQFILTASHTHSGPVLRESLFDCYALSEAQIKDIEEYSRALERKTIAAVGEALSRLKPATLWATEGKCTFAVNRRNNKEAQVPELLEAGTPLKGPVDHSVPTLAVRDPQDRLMAVVFGYSCHNTTLDFYQWCGDYAGFAQAELEKKWPEVQAMFWEACGADQNPLPRRKLELAEKYGGMLAEGVAAALEKPMRPVAPRVRTGFQFVPLAYESTPTEAQLKEAAGSNQALQSRWGKRLLRILERDKEFPKSYPCPVTVWRLGDQLLIAMGGEVVVDYALKFKERFGPTTWVAGYSNDVFAYIPSKRVWEEGGYESGAFIVYGLPTERWAGDIEDQLTSAAERLVKATGEQRRRSISGKR